MSALRDEDHRGEGGRLRDVVLPWLPALRRGRNSRAQEALPSRAGRGPDRPDPAGVVDLVELGEDLPGGAVLRRDATQRVAGLDLVGAGRPAGPTGGRGRLRRGLGRLGRGLGRCGGSDPRRTGRASGSQPRRWSRGKSTPGSRTRWLPVIASPLARPRLAAAGRAAEPGDRQRTERDGHQGDEPALADAAFRQTGYGEGDAATVEDEWRRSGDRSVQWLVEDGAGFLECGHRGDVCAAADVILDEAQPALLVGREDGRRRDRMTAVFARSARCAPCTVGAEQVRTDRSRLRRGGQGGSRCRDVRHRTGGYASLQRCRGVSEARIRKNPGDDLFSRKAALSVSSALESLTSVFGMGTGMASPLESPGFVASGRVGSGTQRVRDGTRRAPEEIFDLG